MRNHNCAKCKQEYKSWSAFIGKLLLALPHAVSFKNLISSLSQLDVLLTVTILEEMILNTRWYGLDIQDSIDSVSYNWSDSCSV